MTSAASRIRILVAGTLGGVPHQGGAAWAVMQYVLGFARLGHDVSFVEPVRSEALRPPGAPLERSAEAVAFRNLVRSFGLDGRAALVTEHRQTVELPYRHLRDTADRADLLVNISGVLSDPDLLAGAPIRAYIDLDPVFNQLWSEEGIDRSFSGHTHFFTVGQSIGQPECPVPTCGIGWLPTLPPVVLQRWPVARRIRHDAFTTVANWRSYGSVEHAGMRYGQKVHSLRRYMDAPRRTGERFLLALGIHPDERPDLRALADQGWDLADAVAAAGTPAAYRRFIQGSFAEFGIAKSGYVDSRSGWFSDRSACYLASGRPVVAQDTGFDRRLPTGEGLLAFVTMDDLRSAVADVRARYDRHRQAARAIAEAYLDSDVVLTGLLERAHASIRPLTAGTRVGGT